MHIASCPGATTWGACVARHNGGKFTATDFNPIAANLLSTYVPAANSGAYGYIFNS